MANKKYPEHELNGEKARKYFTYDPVTGVLSFNARPVEMFAHCKYPLRQCNRFNSKHAGKPAFTSKNKHGNLLGRLFTAYYPAHRVAHFWMNGTCPSTVRHRNGDKADNRWENIKPLD